MYAEGLLGCWQGGCAAAKLRMSPPTNPDRKNVINNYLAIAYFCGQVSPAGSSGKCFAAAQPPCQHPIKLFGHTFQKAGKGST